MKKGVKIPGILIIASIMLMVVLSIMVAIRLVEAQKILKTMEIEEQLTQEQTGGKVTLVAREAENFNSKFTYYLGKNKKMEDVRNLMSLVRTNNIANKNKKEIKCYLNGKVEDAFAISNAVKENKKYLIEAEYNGDGFLNVIKITEK